MQLCRNFGISGGLNTLIPPRYATATWRRHGVGEMPVISKREGTDIVDMSTRRYDW